MATDQTIDAPPAPTRITERMARRYARQTIMRSALLIGLAAAVVLGLMINLATGPAGIPIDQLVLGVFGLTELDRSQDIILWQVRLPIAVMAIVVGACLGLAGAEMQTVLNNPLASPSTLGVMYAATLGAALAIAFDLGPPNIPENAVLPLSAFVGAFTSVMLILFLSRSFGATVDTVILFGIAMVFALEALISLVQFVADSDSLQQIVFWTMGSLARATWEKIAIVGAFLLACLPFSLRQIWKMTALRGGEEYAQSFGVDVERLRLTVLFRVSILTAAAVSFTGVIGFIGLVAPHIARLAFGEDHRFYLPGSILAGSLILVLASTLSKTLVPGILIPDGIVTALVGIPLFLGLLISQKRRGG